MTFLKFLFVLWVSILVFACSSDHVAGTSVDTEEVALMDGKQGFVILGTSQFAGPQVEAPSGVLASGSASVGGATLTDTVLYMDMNGGVISPSVLYQYNHYVETRIRHQLDSDWKGRSVTRSEIQKTATGQVIHIQGNGLWNSLKDSLQISLDSLKIISIPDSSQSDYWFRCVNQNWTAHLSRVQNKNDSTLKMISGVVMRNAQEIGRLWVSEKNTFVFERF